MFIELLRVYFNITSSLSESDVSLFCEKSNLEVPVFVCSIAFSFHEILRERNGTSSAFPSCEYM